MKIGILTQPLGHNYGGLMQNWALQQVLTEMGHETVTLDIRMRRPKRSQSAKAHLKSVMIMFATGLRHNPYSRDPTYSDPRYYRLRKFIDTHIRKTKRIFPPVNADSIDLTEFDAFVIGSDQVWRPNYSPDLAHYFLDFCSENEHLRRIVYAASFGHKEIDFADEQLKAKCANLIQGFDAVSVREQTAIQQCQEYFKVESTLVLDPVFLLKLDSYNKLLDKNRNIRNNSPYVAAYLLDGSVVKTEILKFVSSFMGIEAKALKPISKQSIFGKIKTLNATMDSPIDWLIKIRNSDFVVTDSFHGMCFSIIFKRPFIVIGNQDRGIDRFESLLGLVCLKCRLLSEIDRHDQIKEILGQSINWETVFEKLDELKQGSLNFLASALTILR